MKNFMRRWFVLPVLLVLLSSRPAAAQQTKDPAELMPAKTLAYAETRHVGELAKEIGALLKGSVLSDVPESLQKLQAKYDKGSPQQFYRKPAEGPGIVGLIFSPEIIAELGRLDGAAVAFTGIGADHEPEFLTVVLPGQSNAPAFFMRMFLTAGQVRPTETVNGVTLYRMFFYDYPYTTKPKFDDPSAPPPPAPKIVARGPAFAMSSGVLLIGSTDNVKEAIQRIAGKNPGPSLAQDALFQEARKQIKDQPGLFAFANPNALLPLLQQQGPPPDREKIEKLVQFLNPKAVRALALGLSLKQGNLTYRTVALLDSKQNSPVLDILPGGAIDLSLLRFAPKDTVLAAALNNADGEKRLHKLLAVIDLIDQLDRPGPHKKPSEETKELEAKLGVDLGKDVIGSITNALFVMGDLTKAKIRRTEVKNQGFEYTINEPEIPMVFIIQATDVTAAERLEKLAPKIFTVKPGAKEGKNETHEGRELRSIDLGSRGQMIFYGREGAVLVLGPYAAPVAQSLNLGAKGGGLLDNPQIAASLKPMSGRQALVMMKPAQLIAGSVMMTRAESTSIVEPKPKFKDEKAEPKSKDEPKRPPQVDNNPEVKVTTITRSPEEERLIKDLIKVFEREEVLVIGLQRTDDRIQVDGQVGGLRQLVPDLTNLFVEEYYRAEARQQERYQKMKGDQKRLQEKTLW